MKFTNHVDTDSAILTRRRLAFIDDVLLTINARCSRWTQTSITFILPMTYTTIPARVAVTVGGR